MPRYPIKTSRYSSHSQIKRIVGRGEGRELLDVGCADGTLSRHFVASGWRVVGIEPFVADAAIARAREIEVMEVTLEEAASRLEPRFNAVVLADVLEHCADPWALLREITTRSKPGALIVISLPNVAHVSMRVQLLMGHFNYTDRGILDRTHLRFFTRSTVLKLIESAELRLADLTVTPTPIELVFPGLLNNAAGRGCLGLLALLTRLFPRSLGYQFILTCRVPDDE